MAALLLTGMSGAGKSTALAELSRRGFPVVDTDHGGYSVERPATRDAPAEQVWREDRIEERLARHEGRPTDAPLFVGGCVSNQGRFRSRFAAVVLLSAPADVLLGRVATRTTNGFGRSAADRARILADLAAVEPLLRATADAEIDTRAPVDEIADRLVQIARSMGQNRR